MISLNVKIILLVTLIISPTWTSAFVIQKPLDTRRDLLFPDDGLAQIVHFDVTNVAKLLEMLLDGNSINQALIPATLKILTTPFAPVAEQFKRALTLMIVATYVAADVAPAMVEKLSVLEKPIMARLVGPIISREISETVEPVLKGVSSIGELKHAVERFLALAGLDTAECKSILASKAGHFLQKNYPMFSHLMSSAAGRLVSDDFAKLLTSALGELSTTESEGKSCPSLENMVKNWNKLDNQGYTDVIANAVRQNVAKALDNITLRRTQPLRRSLDDEDELVRRSLA